MFILISILGIGFLILVHETGHFLSAKLFGMRAEKFYVGFPPPLVKKQRGDTEYGIGVIPLGGYVKISGMSREEEIPPEEEPSAFYAKPVWKRIVVLSAGGAMNLLLAFALFFIFYWHLIPDYAPTNTVSIVQEGSGAAAAGLKPGDKLLGVNGVESDDPEVIRSQLQGLPDQQAQLSVERDGEQMTVMADIGHQEESGQGLLGVAFDATQIGTMSIPASEAARYAATDIPLIVKAVFVVLKNLVSEEGIQDIATPIGLVAYSTETIKLGWGIYIRMLGFISLQLAILNMLPLLPLDGGHVLMNIIEKIKGSPVKREIYQRVSVVGLAIFIVFFLIALTNDIQRLIGPGFKLEP